MKSLFSMRVNLVQVMHPDFTTPATKQVDRFWRNCVTRIQSVIPNRSREPRQNIRPPIPSMSKLKPMPEQWTPLPHNSNGRQSCPDMKSEAITKRTQQVPCLQCCMERVFGNREQRCAGPPRLPRCLIRMHNGRKNKAGISRVFCYALFICYPAPP
jgi:hypothetical protein